MSIIEFTDAEVLEKARNEARFERELQEEVNAIALQAKFDKEPEDFYKKVEDSMGLVQSVGGDYLVGIHQYSICFGVVLNNPLTPLGDVIIPLVD